MFRERLPLVQGGLGGVGEGLGVARVVACWGVYRKSFASKCD